MPTVKDIIVRKPAPQEVTTCRQWPTWDCKISSFDWEYDSTETCLINKGQVTILDRPDSGNSISFGPGDLVIFPVGLKCVWKVTQPVNKHYQFD